MMPFLNPYGCPVFVYIHLSVFDPENLDNISGLHILSDKIM